MGAKYTFSTRSKSFSFSLNDYGSAVLIHESHKGRKYSMSIEAEGCKWLSTQLLQMMEVYQEEEFFRTFRNDRYRLTLTRRANKAGEFLSVSKVENGTEKSLMIPKEKDGAGWSNFYVYIKGFFNGNNQNEGNKGRIKDPWFCNPESREPGFGDDAETENRVSTDHLGDKEALMAAKNCMMAITIYRSNTRTSWGDINRKLDSTIKRKSEVFPVAADRAIFWCLEEKELKGLLLNSDQLSSFKTHIKMERWRKEDHWENLQIGVRFSWIGIEGLPLNMWNIHVFKVIGEACGGFLEVAEQTKNKSYLGYAKLKVKGFENGMMNPVIEILCEGEKVCLGAFSIRDQHGGKRGYRTAGDTTRAVLHLTLDEKVINRGVRVNGGWNITRKSMPNGERLANPSSFGIFNNSHKLQPANSSTAGISWSQVSVKGKKGVAASPIVNPLVQTARQNVFSPLLVTHELETDLGFTGLRADNENRSSRNGNRRTFASSSLDPKRAPIILNQQQSSGTRDRTCSADMDAFAEKASSEKEFREESRLAGSDKGGRGWVADWTKEKRLLSAIVGEDRRSGDLAHKIQLLRPNGSYQQREILPQILCDLSSDNCCFKKSLNVGVNQDKEHFLTRRQTGLGQEQEKKDGAGSDNQLLEVGLSDQNSVHSQLKKWPAKILKNEQLGLGRRTHNTAQKLYINEDNITGLTGPLVSAQQRMGPHFKGAAGSGPQLIKGLSPMGPSKILGMGLNEQAETFGPMGLNGLSSRNDRKAGGLGRKGSGLVLARNMSSGHLDCYTSAVKNCTTSPNNSRHGISRQPLEEVALVRTKSLFSIAPTTKSKEDTRGNVSLERDNIGGNITLSEGGLENEFGWL